MPSPSTVHWTTEADRPAGHRPTARTTLEVGPIPALGARHIPWSESFRRRVLAALIGLGAVASSVYAGWWLRADRLSSPWLLLLALPALGYVFVQIFCAWYLYLRIDAPAPAVPEAGLSADVFVPVYDEPYELVARSLAAAIAIRYPHRTYLLDDARDPRFAALAKELGAGYLTRVGNDHAKAGNVNAAIARTDGEFIAIFDVDHIPDPDFLDAVLGHFREPSIGFVQTGLAFHNHYESIVARAAAGQAYNVYGPTSMGMHGCGAAPVWGSHCTFRRAALSAIGGHQTGLTEDLHTALRLHAAGWRSIFVPTLHAAGLVPADLLAFTRQQFKWARGTFGILLTVYPRLWKMLRPRQNLAYLVRLTYYLVGPVFLIHVMAALVVLLFGGESARASFAEYLIRAAPLVVAALVVRHLSTLFWHQQRDAVRIEWRGYALSFAFWPVYTLALVCAVLRIPIPHISTPKQRRPGRQLHLALPQLALIALLLVAVAWALPQAGSLADTVVILFALAAAGLQATAVYAALRP